MKSAHILHRPSTIWRLSLSHTLLFSHQLLLGSRPSREPKLSEKQNDNHVAQSLVPDDLPAPKARLALGLVLLNGEPRYIFPAIDTYIETDDGIAWRNRGLNSIPLGKTWLNHGESPADALRLSAYLTPALEEGVASSDTPAEQIYSHLPVAAALDTAFENLDTLPPLLKRSSLYDGFCFLICPLPDLPESEKFIPARALAPGNRLRVFLSDIEKWPTNIAWEQHAEPTRAQEDTWMWRRGELDLMMWHIPPGRESPCLPGPYAPLYEQPWK